MSFNAVTVGYRPGRPVLQRVSLDIPGGSSVALVGTSGAGKSTLAMLIPRFSDPWHGEVMIDGVSVRDLALAELRTAVSVVFQETLLFGGTVADNIAMARPGATIDEVVEAARQARAHDFITALADGYHTLIGEQGASLSGGQRQRIAIARAILRQPRVLILDDATSAVDPATDRAIRAGLIEVMDHRTTIIIAHRPEIIALADRVILLDEGRVVASGSHQTLLELPAYRQALALELEQNVG